MRIRKQMGAALLLTFAVALAGCKRGGNASSDGAGSGGITGTASGNASGGTVSVDPERYTDEDLDDQWAEEAATVVSLDGSAFSISGPGAAAAGKVLTISKDGIYVLQGTLTDGQVVVEADKEATVKLVLDGADLSCQDGAPLYIKEAGRVILTLADGTVNALTDAETYTYAAGENEPNAALFSKEDLTINGTGSLTVTGRYNNGIASKDDLVIVDGSITVNAAHDGIRGKDSISVRGGTITVTAGGDGLKANNDTDADKGWIALDGGVFTIEAGNDGIQAETALVVAGGSYQIISGGGSAAVSKTDNGGIPGWDFRPGGTQTTTADTESYKGVKAGTSLTLQGGTFVIDAADDALHANGDVTVSDGSYDLSTGDDGVHADGILSISGGTVVVRTSYEGLEGTDVSISGGDIQVKASDDGINAAGGSDTGEAGGWRGPDSFQSGGNHTVSISGGTVVIDADGDGLDSNGSLTISGGLVLVSGPTNSGNGALDYDGSCTVTGGVLIAAGSAGMAQAPGSSSTQAVLMITYTSTQPAGTLIGLTDAKGGLTAAFSPAKAYQSVIICTPTLSQGERYTLYSGGTCSGGDISGYAASGTLSGSAELSTVTLSGVVTSVRSDGSAAGGAGGGMAPGGGGGFGGRPGR